MLKVVGASWHKTNLAICILVCAGLLAIGLFFVGGIIGELRPKYDDSYAYCATSYYSKQVSFSRMEFWGRMKTFDTVPKGVARACYKDNRLSTGWSQFEVETQTGYPDWVQSYAAGLLEGSLTWLNIYSHWVNTIQTYCDQNEETQNFCTWIRDIIMTNYNNTKMFTREYEQHDHYHHQIRLFYFQMEGLYKGFHKGVERARKEVEIQFADFLLLNARGDMEDLKNYFNKFVNHNEGGLEVNPENVGKIFLKIAEEDGRPRILFGHSSEGEYSSMLRMTKNYRMRYHFHEKYDSKMVSNTNIEFSSYPGVLSSTDDFYILSGKNSKMIVGGVRILNSNKNLLRAVNIESSVLSAARIMAANRLARSPKQFAKIMSRDPGFGARQWLVVDEKRLNHVYPRIKDYENTINYSPTQPAPVTSATTTVASEKVYIDGKLRKLEIADLLNFEKPSENSINDHDLIWVVDQIPDRLHGQDVTTEFDLNGYWLLDGNIYFKELESDSKTKAKKPVRYDRNITNLQAVSKILEEISFRGDLQDNKIPFGNVDIKLYSNFHKISGENQEDFKEEEKSVLLVQSGPPFPENHEETKRSPFDWQTSQVQVQHIGQPATFNFEFLKVQFAWN